MTASTGEQLLKAVSRQKSAAEKQHQKRVSEARSLYSDIKGQPIFRTSFALYIDELGAKDRLRVMTNQELRDDLETYDVMRKILHDSTSWDPRWQRYLSFSDNLVVANPLEDNGLGDFGLYWLVFSECIYQANMTAMGRFLRGAIAAGDLYADHSLVTGPALVEAVDLEEKVAKNPRVLLDEPSVLIATHESLLNSEPRDSVFNRFLLVDEDHFTFVNYLVVMSEDESWVPGSTDDGLLLHRKRIMEALRRFKSDPQVRPKYEWAAAYHNYVVTTFYRRAKFKIAGIPERKFSRFADLHAVP